jgi:hypothetical protein
MTTAVMSSAASSSTSMTPSTFAPTSTLSTERPVTSAQASKVHAHQGRNEVAGMLASTPPRKPKIASCTAR